MAGTDCRLPSPRAPGYHRCADLQHLIATSGPLNAILRPQFSARIPLPALRGCAGAASRAGRRTATRATARRAPGTLPQ